MDLRNRKLQRTVKLHNEEFHILYYSRNTIWLRYQGRRSGLPDCACNMQKDTRNAYKTSVGKERDLRHSYV